MALLYFLLIAWVLVGAGRSVAALLRLPASAAILERNLIGYAIGLVLFSYGMLAIGLAGGLYPAAALGLVGVLLLVGVAQYPSMAREALSTLATCFHPQRLVWLMMAVLAFFSVVSLVGCFAPPVFGMRVLQSSPFSAYVDYDSIAYHLADPKLYIQAHRIYPIYWEHHSNFAFTGEMWYTFGLLFRSILLAKLFHWSCGLGASLAIYRLGARFLGQRTAVIAVIVFASTPLVFWEAGTAYVDLIGTFFTTLTLLALSIGMSEPTPPRSSVRPAQGKSAPREDLPKWEGEEEEPLSPNPSPLQGKGSTGGEGEAWIRMSAVLMGLTLSSKATSIETLALFAVALLYWRLRVRKQAIGPVIGQVAVWCVVALVIGCPWYVKAIAYTGNPIYPFYFQIFGGKYWNLANARVYDASNAYFGLGHQPINLLLAPWNLSMYLMPGHPAQLYPNLGHGNKGDEPFNNGQTEFGTISPVLLAALFVPAFLRLRRNATHPASSLGPPRTGEMRYAPGPPETGGGGEPFVTGLSAFALVSFVLWLVTMQYNRYLLPIYPALCLLAAWVIDRALDVRSITGWTLSALTAASVAFAAYLGVGALQTQLPVATGRQTVDDYIDHGYAGYPAMQFINNDLPAGSKIVFYGNPLGFYCDKPYLWGEAGHSTFIPYDKMQSAADLLAYFRSTGVTHVLIAPRYFAWPPTPQGPPWTQWLYQLTAGQSSPVFDERGFLIYQLPIRN